MQAVNRQLGYQDVNVHKADSSKSDVFDGSFSCLNLASGIAFWHSNLVANQTHQQHVSIDRCLMVRFLISASATEIQVEQTRHIINPNNLFCMSISETLTGISRSYKGERYRCFGLNIQPGLLTDDRLATEIDTHLNKTHAISLPVNASLVALASSMANHTYTGLASELLAESWSLAVIAEYLRQGQTAPANLHVRPKHQQALSRVREFMFENVANDLSLHALAKEACMSLTSFKDKYRAFFGETPFETLRAMRLDKAHLEIASEHISVTQAAYEAGYQHVSSFSDAYLRRFGVRPSNT